ncbi:MAG: GNAT family N-acetyltransferase [Endozoicomonas sp.]
MLIVAETPRLIVRTWHEKDLKAYGRLIGQESVSERFSEDGPASRAETELWRYQLELDKRGWSRWAVVLRETSSLIGYCGFAPYGDDVEISWCFIKDHRGRGLVMEAVKAVTTLGFDRLGFRKIITFAASDNEFSRGIIQKLGMSLDRFEGWNNLTVARYSLSSADG